MKNVQTVLLKVEIPKGGIFLFVVELKKKVLA